MEHYVHYEVFDKQDFKIIALEKGEYESCSFQHCDFSAADLSGFRFVDCRFDHCNLSLAKLTETAIMDVRFSGCKMLGLHFDTCDPFNLSFRFDQCVLNDTVFYKARIPKTVFRNCELRAADFTGADLKSAVFEHCNLQDATFDNTILEQADLRSASNYLIDPERNRIRKAQFSLPEVLGLLYRHDIKITGA